MPTDPYTDGLRDLADFLDGHPTLIPPHTGVTVYDWIVPESQEDTAEVLVERFRDRGALLGPTAQTETEGQYFNVNRRFGPHKLQVTMNREVVQDKPPHPLDLPPEMEDV